MNRERSFNHLLAALDELAGAYGLFTAYELTPAEHLGTAFQPQGLRDARDFLEDRGYTHNYLAAAKFHPDPHKAVDHASYRKIPEEHPDLSCEATPRIISDYAPSECQYHVHLYPSRKGIEFWGHYELRPDPRPVGSERPRKAIRRAHGHYHPVFGETILPGVTDLPLE